ncbi:MAG: GreA/GreB family elongation factor [Lentisphaeria bacterium]|nr:GreA/GreB family elongation factor [Lentisphaeria bacterium]MBR3505888.1 GreA/GreB family elongation factor [Lentisphaeria bacterium]
MGINDFSLPDLILYAQLEQHEDAVGVLMDRVNRLGTAEGIQELRAAAPQFEALFEAWDDAISSSVEKAKFCVRIAELSILDSAAFRSSLNYAVRKLLPPYMVSGAVVKALGAKDAGVGVREVALRLKKLQRLRSTAIMYQSETGQCGRITGIDRVTGTIAVTPIDGSSSSSIPIASAIVSAYFFETTPELTDLISPLGSSIRPSSEYRRILNRLALSEVPEQKLQELVQHLLVPQYIPASGFAAWWNAAPAAAAAGGKRHFSDSRSVLELYTLLKGLVDGGASVSVDAASAEKLGKLFVRVSSRLLPKDVQMLAESISWLSLNASREDLAAMFTPLRGQVPFWPAAIPGGVKLANLAIWAKISVKDLDGLLEATRAIYTQDEFVSLGLMLPLRCMTVFFEPRKKAASETKEEAAAREAEDAALIQNIIGKIAAMETLSADVCLWIWKNKARIKSRIITSLVDMETVVAALNRSDLPKEWGAAQRELKRILLGEKPDFRKYLIENADGDIPSIVGSLQKFRTQASELQSVMVKMGRVSPEFMEYIESGEGSKLLGIHAAGNTEQPPVASFASQKRMQAELKNLIEVLIPQNAEAVAYARSFGDLRENAEYDAAKEQRRFLQRRRSELERSLGFMDVTNFSDVEITDTVVPGCRVFLKDGMGKEISYYILGAWDGDVDRGRIAYKAPLGQALVEHKVGEKVKLPELGECVVAKVEPLPAEMIKELSGD